jgi:hypothetical protein
MRKNIFVKILAVIIVIFAGWMIFSNPISQPVDEKETIDLLDQEKEAAEAVLVIDNGIQPRIFIMELKQGMTALDLLKNKTEETGLVLKIKAYDIGILVEAIGDQENGQDGKYWLYYVNGEMPMVASDKNEIKAGDKVEFKFEKSTF